MFQRRRSGKSKNPTIDPSGSDHLKSKISYRILESRLAFDGAAAATAAAATVDQSAPHDASGADHHSTTDASKDAGAAREAGDAHSNNAPSERDLGDALADNGAGAPSQLGRGASVVFIDSSVRNLDQLLSGMSGEHDIVLLDGTRSGMEQIASYLANRTDIGSIDIISHGASGMLFLGTDVVTSENLQTFSVDLSAIGDALSSDGDISIYGCNVAEGEIGKAFINRLADLTSADIAASDDATGYAAYGGDWDLEYEVGRIDYSASWTDKVNADFQELLNVTVSNGDGAFLIAVNNTIHSVDVATGKSIVLTTAPGTVGGVSVGAAINSLAVDQANGLIYYCSNTSDNANRALFAYDFINDTHILIDSDLTNNGAGASIVVGARGVASGSATFHNGKLYFGVEVNAGGGTTSTIYTITFTGAGRTVSAISQFATPAANDWGDLAFDATNNVLLSFTAASGITRYNANTGAVINTVALPSGAGTQAANDISGNSYAVGTTIQRVNPTTGAAIGSALTVTTDGSTAISGTVTDAASWVPQTGVIGDRIFFDNNSNGTFDGTDVGAGNVTVQLIRDLNNNGIVDAADTVLATDTTDASGGYRFSGVLPGHYLVRVTDTNGVLTGRTYTTAGGALRADGDVTRIGSQVLTIDFGVANAAPSAVNDTFTTPHDAAITFNVRSNDTDANAGETLTVTQINGTAITAGGAGVAVTGGVVTLNASGNVVFTPTANYVGSTSFTYQVTDGKGGFSTATVSGTVTNVTPALDLDASGAGTGWAVTYTENGAAVGIADVDAAITDSDDANMESASITLTNPQTGDRLLVSGSAAATGTIGAITWNRTDTTVTFTGTATRAQYAAALAQIQFENTTDTPSTTARTINVVVNDGNVNSNTSVATINIDRAPDPVNDAFSGNEDATISGNVLTNDTDTGDGPGATPLSVVSGPSSGTLTSFNTLTGAFVYTPNANFNGTDTFTYRYTDIDGDSKTATVTLTVNPVNDAPVTTVPATVGPTNEDATLAISGVSVADVDGGALTTTVTVANGALTLGSTGGATVSGAGTGAMTLSGTAAQINAALATLSYVPAADFNGSSAFQVSTSDGALSSTVNRTIVVNAVADIVADSATTNEDAPVTITVLGNDTFENAGRTVTSATNGANGSVTINAGGTITYTPNANFNGVDTFTYTVTSGGVTETATVTVTVNAVNDAPTQILPGAQSTTEDVAVVITGATVADIDNATLTTTLTLPAGTGALSVPTLGGATITGNGTATVTISGTAVQVNAAIASITYTPTADYNGSPTLTISTSDGAATTSGNVAITVTPVADITNDSVTTSEDTARTFNVITGTSGATADTFEGSPSVTSVTQPANGVVTFAANGAITYTPNANFNGTNTFTYTVTSGGVTETATVTVTVTAVNDAPVNAVPGAQTTAEDVNAVFSAANGNAITVTDVDSNVTTTLTVANGMLTLGSISGVTVTGNGTATVTVSGTPAQVTAALNGLTFAPTADWNGSTTLNISTSDGVAAATVSTVGITVTPVADIVANSVTTAEDTATTFNVLANDTFENSGATVTSVTQPANGVVTIGSGGNVTYTPNANFFGSNSFTYTVTSGGVTETTTVTVTVTAVNDAPVDGNETASVTEDVTLSVAAGAGLLANATDVDGGALTVSAFTVAGQAGPFTVGSPYTISGVGVLTINANGSYSFAPAPDYTGAIPVITYTVSDGAGGTDTSTLTLAITAVNDAPVDGNETNTVTEDVTLNVAAGAGLLANATDVDGGTLTVSAFSVGGQAGPFTVGSPYTISGVGVLTVNANGSYSFAPAANYTGAIPVVTYTVSDGNGGTDTSTLTLAITAVNDAPVDGNETNTVTEDVTLNVAAGAGLLANATDVDGGALTISAFTIAGQAGPFTVGTPYVISGVGTLTINANGSYSFAPAANYTGAIPVVTYTVSDGAGGTDTSTLTLAITAVNDAPVDGNETNTVTEDVTLNVAAGAGLLANATDVDGGTLTVSAFTVAGQAGPFTVGSPYSISGVGTLTINANGSYSFAPAANYTGAIPVITYTVSDGAGGTDTSTLTLAITAVNDAPVDGNETNTVTEDVTLSVAAGAGLLANATDVDGGTLTVSAFTVAGQAGPFTVGSPYSISGVGTLTINANGSYSFAPAPDYTGAIPVITYTVSDGAGGTDTSTLTLAITAVNDAPVDGNETNTVTEDVTLNVAAGAGLLANATDVDGGTLTVSAFSVGGQAGPFTVGSPYTISGVGVLTVNANGSYSFAPAANYTGAIPVVTYTVSDGNGGTDTSTLTLAITAVNDAPVTTVPGAQTISEDAATAINGVSVSDVDGGALTTTLSVTNGMLSVATGGGAVVSGNGTGAITIAGTAAQINTALAGLTFNGNADYNGPALLSVSTTDGALTDAKTVAITVTPVADINADTVSGNEDATITFNVLTGAGGASADTFEGAPSVTSFTQPANGSVSIDAAGNVVYAPNANYFGTDTFTYTVTSGGVTETATVTVNVASVNDAPTQMLPPAQSGTEDVSVVFSGANGNQIIVGDVDAGSVTTTLSVPAGSLSAVATMGVTISGNGSGLVTLSGAPAAVTAALNGLTFVPAADANGAVTISVSTTDGMAAPVSGSIVVNLAPVADIQNDSAATNEDAPVTITVLGNDTFENPGRTVTSVTNGAFGTVAINGDGTVTYLPNANFNGVDSFTYTVTSGGATETATVTVTVNPVNDAPTQLLPLSQTTAEDNTLTFSSGNGNPIRVADADGGNVTTTVSATNGILNLASTAGLVVSGDGTGAVTLTGSTFAINAALDGLRFVPTADYNGFAVLSVSTTDGSATTSGIISVSITPVADIVADSVTTNEDTAVTFNVLTNDSFENTGATVTSASSPAHGAITIGANGQITYTPDPNYHGPDSFTYTVTSGGVTETTTVFVTVTPVNDAPITTAPSSGATNEDTPLVFSPANGNALTFSDIDGDTLTVTLSATNGVLNLGSLAGVTVSGNGTATVTVTGSAAALTNALDGLSFGPTADYNGAAAISVTTTDGGFTSSRVIAVTVNPVVDIVADSVATNEDAPITINVLTGTNGASADSFENSGHAVSSVTQGASGTVSFLADGTITYTPDANFHGSDSFTYTVASGGVTETTTVTVTVADVNDVPQTSGLPNRSNLDGQFISAPMAPAFSDQDGDALTYSAAGLPPGLSINATTGVISGTILNSASQTGPYTVVVTASDGNPGGSVSTSFNWTITNPAPTANNDAATTAEDTPRNINVLANDVDPDNDALTVTAASASNGVVTIRPDNTIDYTPNLNFNGSDTIVYQISDGQGGVSIATVTVTITPVNDAPTSSPIPTQSSSDSQSISLNVSGYFSDVDNPSLTFSVDPADPLPPGLSINPATGAITGSIDHLASGLAPYSVTIVATDASGATTSQTFTWNISNPAPTGSTIADSSGVDGTAVTISAGAGFADPDGDTLSFSASNLPAGLTINSATGEISGVLSKDASVGGPGVDGVYSVTVTATDSQGAATSRTFTYTATNPAPTAGDDAFNGVEDAPINGAVAGNDADADGDALTYSLISGPAHGTLTFNPDGTFTYAPDANYNGADTFTYAVTDANGASDIATATLTIAPVNDAPVAANVFRTTPEDVPVSGMLTASDVDGDALTFSKASDPAHGTAVVNASGSYTYAPDPNYFGPDSFTYTVSDGKGGTVTRTVSINVTPVNDAPVAANDVRTVVEDTPASGNVLPNDSDVDGDALSVQDFTVDGSTYAPGTVALLAEGSFVLNANGSYTFTPALDYNGPVPVVSYTVTDGRGGSDTATLTLTVSGFNDPPVANVDKVPVTEDTPASGNVLDNDTDLEGDTLTVTDYTVAGLPGPIAAGTPVTIPGVGSLVIDDSGAFTFTPAANYNGPVPAVTYTVTDGLSTDTGALNLGPVTPVNDAPVAADDSFAGDEDSVVSGDLTPGTPTQDRDIDGDAITVVDADGNPGNGVTPVSGPSHGTLTLNPDGTFSYTPAADFNGVDSFTYRIGDGNGGVAEAIVTLNVAPVNDAPVANDGSLTTAEDTPFSGALPPASDVDGDALTYSKGSDPSHGTVTINTDGTYTYTPNADYSGSDAFTYTVSDGKGGVVTRTITVMVTPVNDEPVLSGPVTPPASVDGQQVTFDVSGFASDVEGDTLTFSATGLPPGLSIDPNTGLVTGTLPANASVGGPYSVTLVVDDGMGGVAKTTFSWPVSNPAPEARDDAASVQPGASVTVNVLSNDRDPDGDALSVVGANASNGTVEILADGSIKYTPNSGFSGADTVRYVISDGEGGYAMATVSIAVDSAAQTDRPVQWGFNGPGRDDVTQTFAGKSAYESISVDGAVIDAVFDVSDLHSLAGSLSSDGAVLSAANGVRSLGGIGAMHSGSVIVDMIRMERVREILDRAGFERPDQDYRLERLPGFSLRRDVPGNLGGLSSREQVIVESLVRQDTLIIQVSNTLTAGDKRIADYRITGLDGGPLPVWLDRPGKDLLVGKRSANAEIVMLRIEAIYTDGATIVEFVKIDTATGEIQPLDMGEGNAPLLFKDQFKSRPMLNPSEIESLGRALAR